jgi:hypothetical protein
LWGAGVFCADLDDSGAEWYVKAVFLTNEILVLTFRIRFVIFVSSEELVWPVQEVFGGVGCWLRGDVGSVKDYWFCWCLE